MGQTRPHFTTRGVVLSPADLSLADWPERARRADLTTVALHPSPTAVAACVEGETGQRFLEAGHSLQLHVEYELHAMAELLPRDLFGRDPTLFRMDEQGDRTPDGNLCVHSSAALALAAENAVRFAAVLRPTTGRYFYWGDDGLAWCRCPRCRDLSDSDQALVLENHLLGALRRVDARAALAHLAYANTLEPPAQVKPQPGIFLEFAPIHRRHDVPYAVQAGPCAPDRIETLDANLSWFGAQGAQVLEYWLDASRFSNWRRPTARVPWDRDVFGADLEAYGERGIRSVTSFAVFIDADYVARHGEPPLGEYGRELRRSRPLVCRGAGLAAPAADAPWSAALPDPYRASLLRAGAALPERMAGCAEPLLGDPAFDPEEIARRARALRLPDGVSYEHPLLERSVRVGLAHIDSTFEGDHPHYGVGAYRRAEHDGFPPTIIAAVDALTLWGMTSRAERVLGYWLDNFVGPDGSLAYYGPSLSEYGQLLTTARRLVCRGASRDWLPGRRAALTRLAERVLEVAGGPEHPRLAVGSPEADTAADRATYFHNNAWLARGMRDWADVLVGSDTAHTAGRFRQASAGLRKALIAAVEETWPADPTDWWLRPMVEAESGGAFERPTGRVTASRLGSYTNYRYWPELLSSGMLPRPLMRRVFEARLSGGGQVLGMTRFEDHLDDWPLAEYLEGLWALGRRADYRYSLWGHLLYHQARGHLTAYEQVTLAPGRQAADYCLPCQLVAARAARRLAGGL